MNEADWNNLEKHSPVPSVSLAGTDLRPGDRVRLWPKKNSDIIDMALGGKIATIETIEQDYEGRIHVAVVVEDDPGKDLGMLRQIGHRFFYSLSEIEPMSPADNSSVVHLP